MIDENVQEETEQPEQETTFTMTTDPMTCFSIELLYTNVLKEIEADSPELVGQYAIYGAAEGILRAAKLLLVAAPNNPELANTIAGIANAISNAGYNIAIELEKDSDNINREKTLLDTAEVEDIMNAIAKINVKLPEHLKS